MSDLKYNLKIPLDVPAEMKETYANNFDEATHGTGRLMLFAGDQKVEHLNDDFHGENIDPEDGDAEHMFKIASQAKIGVFAAQLGLIARYGMDYPNIPYLLKLNSKSHLVKTSQAEPKSAAWYTWDQILGFLNNSKAHILGIGYTIYLGSDFESEMLTEAAELILQAHRKGLITILWIYPRGKAVPNEKDPHIIAGATGVAATLGSDFVKVNAPAEEKANQGNSPAELLKEAVEAAGRTKVVCAGGTSMEVETFLRTLYDQIHIGGVSGNATGRNIHQKPLEEAVRFANAIYSITVENKTLEEALQIYKG